MVPQTPCCKLTGGEGKGLNQRPVETEQGMCYQPRNHQGDMSSEGVCGHVLVFKLSDLLFSFLFTSHWAS